jgi:Tol biopolymer transport system component
MSPEQVRGEKLDSRTDLFSFGLILFEMATGQRAFDGETAAIVHDAILHRTVPPVRELNLGLPVKFEETIRKALEKDRESRYQTAAEILADLKSTLKTIEIMPPSPPVEIFSPPDSFSHHRASASGWEPRRGISITVGLILLFGAVRFLWLWFSGHSPAPSETISVRKIESIKLGYVNPWDTDGHRATYVADDGNLYFGNISGHPRNLVYGSTDPEFRKSPMWSPNRDFSMMALVRPKTRKRPTTLAVVKMDGTGYRELLKVESSGYNTMIPWWSWDNRSLLVFNPDPNSPYAKETCPRLWLVSVADGRQRELVNEGSTKCITQAVFSPDGQFAAYEVWPISPFPQGATSKVYIVPIQGGEPRLIYESDPWLDNTIPFNALGDWTADGKYLAVQGIHEGRPALFLLPMKGGAANGAPVFVRPGDFQGVWSTLSGALIFTDLTSPYEEFSWYLASVGPDGTIGKWTRIELNRIPTITEPSFSPDASQFVYIARNLHSTGSDLIVKDVTTGQERVVYQSNADAFSCYYSATRPFVFCTKRNSDSTTDLLSISVDNGKVERIATLPHAWDLFMRPQGERFFYFANEGGKVPAKYVWDRTTQEE